MIFTTNKIVLIFMLFLILAYSQISKASINPDFLWNIVNQDCVTNQKSNGKPDPCVEVFFEKADNRGHAIFKDQNGALQYLLLPITKITGIESPDILRNDSPNYFYQAWVAKSFMEKKYNSNIADEVVSLTVNSQISRSQNQLHIHISCIRPEVKDLIDKNLKFIGENWGQFPESILGHIYFTRHLTLEQLKNKNAFQLLSELTTAKNKIFEFGLGLVAIKNTLGSVDFILLAAHAQLLPLNNGHVEEIQDHNCPQLLLKN
jgi:CDP-diacylglycerol pyrophosphatase